LSTRQDGETVHPPSAVLKLKKGLKLPLKILSTRFSRQKCGLNCMLLTLFFG